MWMDQSAINLIERSDLSNWNKQPSILEEDT